MDGSISVVRAPGLVVARAEEEGGEFASEGS